MPTFGRVARHIGQLLAEDPANADRIRALLPPQLQAPPDKSLIETENVSVKPVRKRTPKTAADADLSALAADQVKATAKD